MLTSLRIQGFRTFRLIDIAGLGHVNLLVGRNNTGKSMALEAVRLLVSGGHPAVIRELLSEREEFDRTTQLDDLDADLGHRGLDTRIDFRALFHGRPSPGKGGGPRCAIGADNGYPPVELAWVGLPERDDTAQLTLDSQGEDVALSSMALAIVTAGERRILPIDHPLFQYRRYRMKGRPAGPPLVPARGLTEDQVASWWDSVALTDAEERVVECLRIATSITKIALVENPWKPGRSVVVRIQGEREPVPLRSLGDGIGRMFWIALAMERARETGVLLLDEIENGIHYTVLPDLWRFIFHTARVHGIQVFATSHSWDCIEAFTEVAGSDADSRGVLVQLTRRGEDIVPTVLSEDELRLATREGIEVRG